MQISSVNNYYNYTKTTTGKSENEETKQETANMPAVASTSAQDQSSQTVNTNDVTASREQSIISGYIQQTADDTEDDSEVESNCTKIYNQMISGATVSESDKQYLREHNSLLYAKAISASEKKSEAESVQMRS